MNFNDIIHTLNDNLRKTVNKIVKTQTKLSKCESAITFNGLCIKEYIYVYIYRLYRYVTLGRLLSALARNFLSSGDSNSTDLHRTFSKHSAHNDNHTITFLALHLSIFRGKCQLN